MKSIIFIGGVHGVGKSQICKNIASKYSIPYFSSSDLIGWSKLNQNQKNKVVEDISYTQALLLKAIETIDTKSKVILLDGHFTLLTRSKHRFEKVGFDTFGLMNVKLIAVVTLNVQEIHTRLLKRDGVNYPIDVISKMQDTEIEHGESIALSKGIPFLKLENSITNELESQIQKVIRVYESST